MTKNKARRNIFIALGACLALVILRDVIAGAVYDIVHMIWNEPYWPKNRADKASEIVTDGWPLAIAALAALYYTYRYVSARPD